MIASWSSRLPVRRIPMCPTRLERLSPGVRESRPNEWRRSGGSKASWVTCGSKGTCCSEQGRPGDAKCLLRGAWRGYRDGSQQHRPHDVDQCGAHLLRLQPDGCCFPARASWISVDQRRVSRPDSARALRELMSATEAGGSMIWMPNASASAAPGCSSRAASPQTRCSRVAERRSPKLRSGSILEVAPEPWFADTAAGAQLACASPGALAAGQAFVGAGLGRAGSGTMST